MKVGFVGLGAMGAPMAANLLHAGHELSVFDVNAEAMKNLVAKGARAATSPADCAKGVQLHTSNPCFCATLIDRLS
eukprot:5573282-Pleurochrysis_carterae.AAC.1